MRNYVIINGVNSSTKNGLAISNLPPITKPLMRNQREEINGRDGDLITDLGYAAYDKQIEIGLYNSYDIDSIIKYFTGEGTITFSNETDKYYKFKILNQIDYNKLLKFKTATVTFHCQPYKYSTTETTATFNTTGLSQVQITNNGNCKSNPTIKFTGTGTVNLSLNGYEILVLNLGDSSSSMTIDTDTLEAYNGTTLLNRNVTGDYTNLRLSEGLNTITWTGTLTKIEISNYSRWI